MIESKLKTVKNHETTQHNNREEIFSRHHLYIQNYYKNDCINCENAANLNIPCTHCLPVSLYIIIIRD